MKCDYNCLHCPFLDCVEDVKVLKNSEDSRSYYERHRAERLAYQKAYNEAHKATRHERSKQRWANMTEAQREKERARQREAYKKRKESLKTNE